MEREQEFNKNEVEQTPEEIREVLEKALEEKIFVDLLIANQDKSKRELHDMIVEELEGDTHVWTTYVADTRGNLGPVLPLEISRIITAKLKKLENGK